MRSQRRAQNARRHFLRRSQGLMTNFFALESTAASPSDLLPSGAAPVAIAAILRRRAEPSWPQRAPRAATLYYSPSREVVQAGSAMKPDC